MIKLSIRPNNRVVAGRTLGRRKPSADVGHRCGGVSEVRHVAERANRLRCTEVIATIRGAVALVAGIDLPCRGHLVCARERETGGAVIERCCGPANGAVAGRTILTLERCVGLGRGDVVWIRRAVVIRRVTATPVIPTIRRRNRKRGVVAVMAALAGRFAGRGQLVGVLQREISVVRELSIGPGHGVMAARALRRGRRETSQAVVHRCRGVLVVAHVTAG